MGLLIFHIRYSRSSISKCQQKRPITMNNFYKGIISVSRTV